MGGKVGRVGGPEGLKIPGCYFGIHIKVKLLSYKKFAFGNLQQICTICKLRYGQSNCPIHKD